MFQRVSQLILRKKQHDPPVEERRVWVRHTCRVETTLHPAGDGETEPISARVRNVSRGGIMLIANRHVEAGDMVSVELPGESAGSKWAVLACVLNAQPESENEWALSCSFAAELSDDDLRAFGIGFSKAVEAEQRAMIRYPCRAKVVYEVISGPTERGYAGVLNLSAGGIGLATAHPIAVGTMLNVDLFDDGDRPVVAMLASVVSARPMADGKAMLGCTFLGELTEEQLRELV